MRQLSSLEINDILDRFDEWLTYTNVVSIDVLPVDADADDLTYELVVGRISEDAVAENAKKEAAFGIAPRVMEVPKEVSLRDDDVDAELIEDGLPRALPTRIVETDEIVEDELVTPLYSDDEDFIEETDAKVRPCPGGYLIKAEGLTGRGTLGTSISYGGTYRILSNNHVIAKNGNVGKWVFQPNVESTTNRLKKVTDFVFIKYYASATQTNPTRNVKDVAWCDSDSATSSQKVRGIGNIAGRRSPVVGETVKVFGGETAALKTAKIESVTHRYRSNGTLGYSWWKNGIKLDANITQAGDSGSAYVASSDSKLVGLHRVGGSVSVGAPL